jgi:hypothetical protein
MKKNYTKTENKKVINENTAEILSDETTVTKGTYESEPDYIKLYIKDVIKIIGLKGNSNKVLTALLPYVNYKNEIALIPAYRKDICTILKLKPNSLAHILTYLQNSGILIDKGINQWLLNPYFFGKGKWTDIQRLRLTIEYSASGRVILPVNVSHQREIDFNNTKK